MAASQGKCPKQVSIIEKHLKRANRNESKDAIINDYGKLLLAEKQYEKEEEKTLKSLQGAQGKIENPAILQSFLTLQEKVQMYEKQLASLQDDIDNFTIQSIAENESFKIQQAEKEREIKSFYISEEKRAVEELAKVERECARKEEEIRNQISLEIAAKNARLYELRGNLQRQIIEKNNDYTKAQNEGRELRKQLEQLKANMKQNGGNDCSNIMKFQSNASAPHDKPFSLPNIPNVAQRFQFDNNNYTINLESANCPKESSKQKENARITDKERSRLADEYEQFEKDFKLSSPPLKMKPNPCNIVANRDKTLHVKNPNNPNLVNIDKTEPCTDDLDETIFFDVSDPTEISLGNAPRKLPTVYMGKAQKRKPYRPSN